MNVKKIYEKMVDYRQFGVVLLAAGSFFFMGLIIPFEKTAGDLNLVAGASLGFLLLSALLLTLSKGCRNKLVETEEGQEYLMKK
ncbi:YrhC family protein [Mesobacillus zeae]|uniref:YrhC family protein n=1 Tax=Mesobacillus zeae TaxID=1917180 RepID=A0A398B1Q2_9BACI|nr:YrhC family protein [Mesobacillus zeae]RID83765.1 hypothetical protein D1970_14230 [Mesobacillus zeae]